MLLSRVFVPLAVTAFALVFGQPAFANPLDRVDEDDREALEALAVYPEEIRNQALEVASEAGTLLELQKLQDDSQSSFRELLEPYSQDDQEQLFELSRYPDLVQEIASGQKSRGELERLAADYPEEARSAAVRQGGEHHKVVSRMHALLADFDRRFEGLVEDLSPHEQDAFRAMLRAPELLSLLSEHTNMTVLLGDAFDRDPNEVREALKDLNLEVARRNAEEADDWKQKVDADPDLRRDYDSAANDYRRETGYDPYQAPSHAIVNVDINPYPYWFGYPWWYPVSYTYYDPWFWWYPRRSWGYSGYSFGPRAVFYGGPMYRLWYPSFHFTSWYFSFGHHHARYPYLSDHFVSYYDDFHYYDRRHHDGHHYDGHRRVVRRFVYETDHVMPAKYFRTQNRRDRIERFREYGKIAPEIEKVRRDTRQKELRGKGSRRPGRDFRLREEVKEDKAAREEVRKVVRRNPKEFPELAKVKQADWEKPVARDARSGGKRGGDAPDLEAGRHREKSGKQGDAGKGKDQSAKPRTIGREKTRETQPGFDAGGSNKKDGQSREKARPALQRPGGDDASKGGSGGGKRKNRSYEPGSQPKSDAPKARRHEPERQVEKPRVQQGGGGDGGGKRKNRSYEPESQPKSDAPKARRHEPERQVEKPRVQQGGGDGGGKRKNRSYEPGSQPKSDAPKARRHEPERQVEKPRVQQGGGGDGGQNRKKMGTDKDDEQGGGGNGGGGGAGKRHRND